MCDGHCLEVIITLCELAMSRAGSNWAGLITSWAGGRMHGESWRLRCASMWRTLTPTSKRRAEYLPCLQHLLYLDVVHQCYQWDANSTLTKLAKSEGEGWWVRTGSWAAVADRCG